MPIIEDLKQKDEERKKSTQYSFDPVPVPSKKVNGAVSFKSSDSSYQATPYSQDPLDYVTSLHFTRNGTTYDISSDAAKTLANGYLYKSKSDPMWAVQAQTASTDSYTDAVLKKWGIPSAASLDDLIEYAGGGSVSDVYGGVSENQWAKIKEMWSKEWKYDATDVDTQRQSQGLAPSSFDSQYENTLLDAQLKEMGLPPSALISKTYANEYNIWVGNNETWNDIMYDAAELVSKSTEKPQESEGGLLSNATNAAFEDATIAPITFDEAIKQVIASNPEYTEFVGNHLGTYTELPDRDDEKYILKDQYGLDVGFDSAAYNKDLQAAIEKNAKLQGDEFALTAEGFDEYYAGKYAEIKYDEALKTEALTVTADELFTAESLEGMDAPTRAKADEYAATATEILASQGLDAFIKYIDEDIPASVQANNDAFTDAIEASAFSASPTEAVSVLKDYYIGYGYDEEKATELAQSAYADTNYAYVYGLNASEIEQVRGGADVTTIVTAKLSTEEGKQEYSTIRAECYFGALYGMSQKEIQAQIDSWTETKAGISSTGYIPQDASGWGGYVDNRNQSGNTPAGEAAWRAAAAEYTTGTTRDDDGTPHTANEKAQWARNEAQTKIDYYTDMMNAYNALQSSYYYATLKENDDFAAESKCETGYSDIEDDSVNPIPTLGALQSTLYVYANNCTRYASDGSAHGGTSGKVDVSEPPINLDDDGYIVLGDVAERGKTCMELAKYLSDDELAMYNYLWNTQGAEKASAYFGKLLPTLDSRAVKRGDKTAEEFAAAHPFWASAFSVPVGMAEGVISFVKSTSTRIDNAISSRDGVSIALRESQLPHSSDVWRSTVSQKLGEHGWGAAYQIGMSLADSAAIIGLTYATGGIAGAVFGAGSTAASTAANVASWVGTSALGAKAFNSTLHDGLERGLSDAAAYKTALAAGIFETLFEKVSLDVFTSGMGGFAAVKQAIAGKTRAESVALIAKYVLETQAVQSFTEASEELNTELANVLYDFIANGDMNEYEQRAAYLMSDEGGGLSREEAYAQADKEMTDRFVQAGAGGAISGFIMGGGGAIISSMTGTYGTQNRLQAVSETVKNTSAITAKDATTFVRQNGQFVDGEITMESAIDVFNKLYDKGADSATIQSVKQAITTEKTSDDVFNAIESIADKAQARTRNALVNAYRKAGLAKGTSRSQLESEIQSYLNGVDYAVKASDVASIDTAVAAVKNGELERVVEKLNNSRAKKASGMSNAGAVSTSTRHVQSLVKNGTISAESTDVTRKLFATRKQSGATTTLSTAFATDAALLTQYAGQADFSGVAEGKDAASLSNAAKTGAVKSLASENGDATRLLMHEASGDALNGRVPAITALCGEDGDAGAFAAAVIAIASNSQTGDARAAIYKQMTERGYSSSLMSLLTYAVLSKGQSADGNSGIMTLSQVSELTAEIGKQQEAAANAKASLEATQADISTSETEAEAKVKRHEATRDAFEPTAENAEKIANANAEVNNATSALDNLRSENAKRLATTKKESNAAVKSANAKIKKARAKLATHSAQYVSLFSSDIYAMQNGRAINRASIDARTKALESYSMTAQEQADKRVIDEEKRRVQRFAVATGTQIEIVAFDDAFAKSHPFSESTPFDADAYGVTIGDSIYLNEAKIDPHDPITLRIAMTHELTHFLERDAATYKQLCDFVRSTIGSKYDACVSEITDYYASRGINLDRAHAERELVALFASETLLQSPSAIASLVETSRPVANRFMEWLNGVLEKVGRYDADKMITRGVALYKNALNAASASYSFDNIAAGAAQADEDASVPKSREQRVAATTDNPATSVKSETPVQDVAPEQAETASQNADAPVSAEEPTHETQDVQADKQTQAPVQEQSDVAQQSEQTDGEYYVQTRTGAKPVTGTMRDGFGFRTADGQIEVTLLDTGAAVHHAATVEEAIAYVDEHKAELIASQQTEEAQRKAANFRELRDVSLQYRGQAAPATARRQRNTSLLDAIDTPIDAETADIQYSFGTDADYMALAENYDPQTATAAQTKALDAMVREAARENGYTEKVYHGSREAFNVFSNENAGGLFCFTDNAGIASMYANGGGGGRSRLSASQTYVVGIDGDAYELTNGEWRFVGEWTQHEGLEKKEYQGHHFGDKLPIDPNEVGDYWGEYAAVPKVSFVRKFFISANSPLSLTTDEQMKNGVALFKKAYAFAENSGATTSECNIIARAIYALRVGYGFWQTTQFEYVDRAYQKYINPTLVEAGYDSIRFTDDGGVTTAVFSPEQIKSADPVVRDDNGNIVPLSERFNDKKQDIRYSLKEKDSEYMRLAQEYNPQTSTAAQTKALDAMVQEAARKNGYTIKAYHGTAYDFNVFDNEKRGMTTQAKSASMAIFLTDNEKVSDYYANYAVVNETEGDLGWYDDEIFTVKEKIEDEGESSLITADGKTVHLSERLSELESERQSILDEINNGKEISKRTIRSYIKIQNPYTHDFNGEDYRDESYASIISSAKENGYDGVILKNTYDGAGKHGSPQNPLTTIYAVFDSSQIKSADPVTYDDNGNIIPLSERFNSSTPDIRWYNGFDYNGLLEKYGVIEDFSRRPVPKKTSETKTTSKSAQKVADSYVLSDKQHEEVFKPLVASEAMSYVPVANNKTLAAATTRANANTLAENIVLLRDMAESGRTNAEDGAFAQLMIQRAAQSGTQEELEAVLAYSSIISVEAGRSLQIQSLLKRMSPNGKLRYMESIIGKINAKYATKLKQPYELTTAERNALLNSNSPEESDAIIEQISKRIGETLPLTFGDRIKAWRYFSMLSSAKTHLRNIMGNITMASMYNVSDVMGAAVESAAVRAGTMTQDERMRAVFSRASRKDVVAYANAAFDERQGSLAQGSKFVDKGFGVEKYKRMFDWKPLDKAAKGVFSLLEKEDQFFMKKRFVSVMSQMIVARGYDVNNITDEQRTTLVQQASEEALKATFRDASKVADVLTEASKIKGVGLLVEGIIPFKKTPINVLKRGVDFSALGLLRGIYDVSIGVKSGKITTAQAISHLTDGLTGTAVMALGWLLSRLGVLSIVGGDGDDEDYDKFRRNLGDYQYMMSIGDVNFDLSGIAPIVFPLFMGAAIDEVSENGLPQFESVDDLFTVLAQVADPLTEMSMLSGVNTVLDDIAYAGDDGAISTVVRSALSSVAQQFIPTPIGQLERTFDPYSRSYSVSGKGWLGKSASYTAKAIQNKTPFAALSEPSVDLHGEEVRNFSGFGSFLLNLYNQNIAPVTVRVDRKDETDEEIMRVYEATLDTGVVPQKPNRSLGYVTDAYGETVTFTLTDSEYTEYQKELGQAIYAQLRLVMANESYATLDDDKKAQVLSNVISTVTSETKKQWKQMKIEQAAADGTLRTKKTP